MVTRRDWLAATAAAGAALTLDPRMLRALQEKPLLTRAIPSSGEQVPLVGLGSSATFSRVARSEDFSALKDVMAAMIEHGGTVFDTAPSYGASEEVAGSIAAELGITEKVFWATKLNVAGRGGGAADPARAMEQLHSSFQKLKKSPMDLIQVHNLADIPTQLGILKEQKQAGNVRYIGVTTTSDGRHSDIVEVMRNEPIDFVGIDYAIDDRGVEEDVLPAAIENKVGVLVYVPFGRTRLWQRVGDRPVPEWAAEFDATTWAQFFIKFVAAHPAVTCVTPATSQAKHMIDNMGAAHGKLPNEEQRKRMIEVVDALPPAPRRGG